jgi:hypothetical protein
MVVVERGAVGEFQPPRSGIDRGDRRSEPQIDLVLGEIVLGFEGRVVSFTADDFLRQWRPVVREVILVADEHHLPVVPELAHLLRRP